MINILVVDDEPIIAKGIAKKIRSFTDSQQQNVTVFTSSQEALAYLAQHAVDLIFSDINMPELSGLELVEALQKSNPQSEIVIITGFGSLAYAKQAMEFGVRHFLEKPVQPQQLKTAYLDSLERLAKRKVNWRHQLANDFNRFLIGESATMPPAILEAHPLLMMFDAQLEKAWLPLLQKKLAGKIFIHSHYQNACYFLLTITEKELMLLLQQQTWSPGIFFVASCKEPATLHTTINLGLLSFEKEFYFKRGTILQPADFKHPTPDQILTAYFLLKENLPRQLHQQDFIAAKQAVDTFLAECQRQLAPVKQVQAQVSDLVAFLMETYELQRDTILQEASLRIVFSNQIQSLSFILHYCLAQIKQQQAPLDANNIPASLNYLIENHYANENLSLRWIAKNMLFLNPDYLGRKYYQLTGNKFNNKLVEFRMQKAEALILNGKSIHEVAEAVGYKNNPEYFCQVFKKVKGTTPHRYLQLKE